MIKTLKNISAKLGLASGVAAAAILAGSASIASGQNAIVANEPLPAPDTNISALNVSWVYSTTNSVLLRTPGVSGPNEGVFYAILDTNGNVLVESGTGTNDNPNAFFNYGVGPTNAAGQSCMGPGQTYYVISALGVSHMIGSYTTNKVETSSGAYVAGGKPETYGGIVMNELNPQRASSGIFTLLINGKGTSWQATVNFGGKNENFKGALNPDGSGSQKNSQGYFLSFSVDNFGDISGQVSDSANWGALIGSLQQSGGSSIPFAGERVDIRLMNIDPTGQNAPGGFGYATGRLAENGLVRWSGRFPDGRLFASSSLMGFEGNCPLYFANASEVAIGNLQMVLNGTRQPSVVGNLYMESPGTKAYPQGWSTNIMDSNMGSVYVAPVYGNTATRAFPSPTADFAISYGTTNQTDNTISINYYGVTFANQQGTQYADDRLSVLINATNGVTRGSVRVSPVLGTSILTQRENFWGIINQSGSGSIYGQLISPITRHTYPVIGIGKSE